MIYKVEFADGTSCCTGYRPLALVWAKRKGSRLIEVDDMAASAQGLFGRLVMHNNFSDEIARRLRAVAAEHGEASLKNAVIVGPPINADDDFFDTVCGLTFISCPTMGDYRLGGVTYKTARAFEDA